MSATHDSAIHTRASFITMRHGNGIVFSTLYLYWCTGDDVLFFT